MLKDIIARSAGDAIELVLQWQGGEVTEVRFAKTRTGHHRYVMPADSIELVRTLAAIQPDSMIASILNRMRVKTAHGESWTARRVCSVRNNHKIPPYRDGDRQLRGELTVPEVAKLLGLTPKAVLYLIRRRRIAATQVCVNAPWIVRKEVAEALRSPNDEPKPPQPVDVNQLTLQIQ